MTSEGDLFIWDVSLMCKSRVCMEIKYEVFQLITSNLSIAHTKYAMPGRTTKSDLETHGDY